MFNTFLSTEGGRCGQPRRSPAVDGGKGKETRGEGARSVGRNELIQCCALDTRVETLVSYMLCFNSSGLVRGEFRYGSWNLEHAQHGAHHRL